MDAPAPDRAPRFAFARTAIDVAAARASIADPSCGGYAAFEGWVRNHNEGQAVHRLEYEAYPALAQREGERILTEAIARFGVEHAACIHRIGELAIGELAVWVGITARHRHEAFLACRYIIDEVKHRVPIWKKEHYVGGDSGWVNCERCAQSPGADPMAAAGPGSQVGEHATPHAHGSRAHGSHDHAVRADYSRQVALREVGPEGQRRLRAASVLVVGCGGLGAPVIAYLAGAGIGRLGLLDSDRLEASNLHRQTLYALADCGRPKAELAAERVRALNPEVAVSAHVLRLEGAAAQALIGEYDLVVDCSDNFATRFLVNDVCVRLGRPAVFASVYQYEGQLQVVRPERGGACLRCIWPEATRDGLVGNCAEAGVLGPVPGVLGSMQAFEALRVLLDLAPRADEILMLDLLTLRSRAIRIARAADCPGHALLPRPASADVDGHGEAGDAALEVTVTTLAAALEAGYTVIDVRDPDERRSAPPPAAERVPHRPVAELLHGGAAFTPAGRTLLLCASGRRSRAAARELRARGLTDVWSLRGGLAALADAALADAQGRS